MKIRRIILATVLVSSLVLSGAILGCDLIPKTKVETMMDRFPSGIGDFAFTDTKLIRGDDDLESLYNNWKAEVGSTLALCGIEADDVDGFASGDGAYIYDDGFKSEEVEAALTANGFERGEYKDVEVWKNTQWIALIDHDLVIVGTESGVKACIDVIEYDEDSLLDNDDAEDVLGTFYRGASFAYTSEEKYPGLVATGLRSWEKNDDTLNLHYLFKFESKEAAKAARADIEAAFADLEDLDVDRDDEYLDVTGETPTADGLPGI